MVYIILSVFVVEYMVTMWLVYDLDRPENYKAVNEYMHSKYYVVNNIRTSLLVGCLLGFYFDTKEWLFPLIAFVVIVIDNTILSIRKMKFSGK